MGIYKNSMRRFLNVPEDTSLRGALANRLLGITSSNLTKPTAKLMKYIPYPASGELYILQKLNYAQENTNLPIPPQEYLDGYPTEDWIRYGKEHIDAMTSILDASDFSIHKCNRILDFGCSSGRMIRWLADLTKTCEIWGVDISARQIVWCQENLTPPFNFATVTIMPHLPFEDRYFDLIYCGSVFTHIDDLAEAWLLEVKRILKPDGRLYVTVHDKHSIDLIMHHSDRYISWAGFRTWLLSVDKDHHFEKSDYYMYSILPGGPESQVFYDINYLQRRWGRILNILSVTPEAYGYQTAVLMRK
jgi:ubiquinone/menaquinone biosynthesis C-methylase UbiE